MVLAARRGPVAATRLATAMILMAASHAVAAALPAGTKVAASFPTESGKGPEALFDSDDKTFMTPAPNVAAVGKVVWIDLKFPEPIENLSGITTGESDKFGNYYAKSMEFWADSDGNGTFDTLLGKTDKLGPAKQSAGSHAFDGRLPQVPALRIRVTEQNVTGNRRAFIMNEMGLVQSDGLPPIEPTPQRNSEGDADQNDGAGAAAKTGRAPAPKPIAADASIVPGAEGMPGKILPLPEGTKVEASFATEKGRGPDKLFDNDLATIMTPGGGSAKGPFAPASITLRFPEPVANLGGIETGATDPFKNYYPKVMEFWADSDGDGRFDTLLGRTNDLGPAQASVGRHAFSEKLDRVHGLEIRTIEQNFGGGKRVFPMNEMRLVSNADLPTATATPKSYRILNYVEALPAGTTASASFKTEAGKGPDRLLDNDPTTFLSGAQATAKEGVPVSVFLRFPAPVKDLVGIKLGGSDPFRNYVWQTMDVLADTNGDGTYDQPVATFTGGGTGERRFPQPVAVAHGLELRVTKQSLGGTFRAFMLSGIEGLVYRDDPGDQQMEYVVEDFEDFSSWRTWANNTGQPEGERPYGGFTFLAGAHQPDKAKDGVGVGVMRYHFKPEAVNPSMWAKRGRVSTQEALIDRINFWANPQGYDCAISFELFDARGKKFKTPPVKIAGNAWQQYGVDLNAETLKDFANYTYPFKLEHVYLAAPKGGSGDVLLDNISYVGVVDRNKRVRIRPAFEGMTYAPDRSVTPSYRVWNALGRQVQANVEVSLYSAFDAQRRSPLQTRSVPVVLPPKGHATVPVDLGMLPYGHYHVRLSTAGSDFAAEADDQVAVARLNGGRINKSPMWFGSMHSMGWMSYVENQFVIDNVIKGIGLDAYRTGSPDQDNRILLKTDLLFAAGFGGMPAHLRLPSQKSEHRGEPNDYDAYFEHVSKQARERYAPYADRILSVEYYNEPDLPGFEYLPEIDAYLKMHEVFRRAFRAAVPGVRIGTGGNTVQHGKEKKDFNRRMYTELAKEADVALWHAHGALENYVSRHRMVESWTAEGGRPRPEQLLGNSEAGNPSGESQVGFLNQADSLVKKVGWAKAQGNSLFYIWFTTTDTFDPQGGYLNNENWGLVTYNQRLKPSGQAYNELIRKLANTTGGGETTLDSRLQVCAFVRDDGTQVWLGWPRERGAAFLTRLSASGPVTVTDMFGHARAVEPNAQGMLAIEGNGYPFYLEAPKGATVGPAAAPTFITYRDVVGLPPGTEMKVPVTLKSVWDRDVQLRLTLTAPDGTTLAETTADVPAGQGVEAALSYRVPADAKFGSIGGALRVRSVGPENLVDETLPMTIVIAQTAPRIDAVAVDGATDAIARAIPIVLDKSDDLQDLVSDPSTPNWAGPNDLAATATVAHDGKGVFLRFDVRDQAHDPGPATEKLWTGDSVQVAFYAGSAHTEIGLTESGGGFGWSYTSPDAARVGKPMDAPIAVKRQGDRTIYEAYLSFASLGIRYEPMFPLRMTFLVNEADGRGRVRVMKWFDGIAASKDVNRFGHVVLE